MKAVELYFPVVLFIMLYKVVLHFNFAKYNLEIFQIKLGLTNTTVLVYFLAD